MTIFPVSSNAQGVENNELIIKLKDGYSVTNIVNEGMKTYNTSDSPIFTLSNFKPITTVTNKGFSINSMVTKYYRFKSDSLSMTKAQEMLKNNKAVAYVEPNYAMQLAATPNDPLYPNLYHLPKMNVPTAWDRSTGSTSVIVAVVDSGVDYNHEDIRDNMWHGPNGEVGYDFGDNDSDPMDSVGHGTHMAGVIGSVGNNSIGTTGINWRVRIMAVKVLGVNTVTSPASTIASGIIYAADNGAKVINMSFGTPGVYSQTIVDAINYAYNKGAVLVASSGNYVCPIWFPANQPNIIAAGATDQNDQHPSFSCGGPELDLTAPSVNIISIERGGGYTSGQGNTGTSYSAAMVSGAAALLFSAQPGFSNTDVINRLTSTADDLGAPGRDDAFGYGRVNLARALDVPIVTTTPYPSPYPTNTPGPTIPPSACTYTTGAYVKDINGNTLAVSGPESGLRLEWKFTSKEGKYYEGSNYFNNGVVGPFVYTLEDRFRDIQAEVILHVDRNQWDLQEDRTFCHDNSANRSCVYASKQTVLANFVCGANIDYGWVLKRRNSTEPIPTIPYPTPTAQPNPNPSAGLSIYTNMGEGANVPIGKMIRVCYTVPQSGKFTFSTFTSTWQRVRSYIDDGRGDCFIRQVVAPEGKHTYRIEMNGEVRETSINATAGSCSINSTSDKAS